MKTLIRMATYWAVILVVTTSTSLAQGAPREECGEVTLESGQTTNSIQGCMTELFDQQFTMIDSIGDLGEELRAINMLMLSMKGTTASDRAALLSLMDDMDEIQLMKDQLDRSRDENLAVEDSDHADSFEKADQKKGKDCEFSDMTFFESLDGDNPPGLKPFSGSNFDPKFGDGKCNVFKARIDNPGEPDDNEAVRVNERMESMCERVCEDRVSASPFGFRAPRPKKEERKDRTVFALTDNIAAARRANEDLEVGKARISALRVKMAAEAARMAGENTDPCEPFDVARILDEIAEGVGLVKNAIAVVTASLELAKETARPPSKQDAAGFNASSAETPFSVAAGVSKIVEQAAGFIESGFKVAAVIAGRIQDFAQSQCLENVQTQVVAVQAAADELQETADATTEQLNILDAKVDSLSLRVDELLRLLRTPPGRRDGFPNKTVGPKSPAKLGGSDRR